MTVLTTNQILLRPFALNDARDVQRLAGDWAVARMVPSIPHPYSDGLAESWIDFLTSAGEQGREFGFAIVPAGQQDLIGAITLMMNKTHFKAEIGYWIGHEFWGYGFATEACRMILQFGFMELPLNRMFAPVMARNTASIRVLEKAGLSYEGTAPQSLFIRGQFEDISTYGIVRSEYGQTAVSME